GLFVFAAVVHHVHATDRHLEGFFNRLRDLVLVRVAVHLERVLAELGGQLVRLFRETDEFENLVGLHQFLPPLTRAMIASSALVLTMIVRYCARSSVLSFAASCRETRSILRTARVASAANGAST